MQIKRWMNSEPDFQSFGLVSSSWNRFVVEMTVRFGFPDKYSHREVMFVLTSIDTDGEMTGTTEDQKLLINNFTMALNEAEKRLTLTNEQRLDALVALISIPIVTNYPRCLSR